MAWTCRPNCSLNWRTNPPSSRSRNRATIRARITDLVNACGDRYLLFCGVDDLVMESFMLGARGWVSGLVNAFPAENRLLWDLLLAGRFEEALAVYRWYTPMLHLDTHVKLVQYIKLANVECGFGSEVVRAPRLPLVGEERQRILKIIRDGIKTRPTLTPATAKSEQVLT
jgi:4-hydroxy-tetrahydrodipicolinate synthase